MTLRTIAVDDEPLARERLRTLVALEPDLALVAECRDGASAVTAIDELQPDLVLLDIQMPEMDGFEVLEAVRARPVVVFITAYDEYALRAFDIAAADYVLKPIDEERFHTSIVRAREKLRTGRPAHDDTLARLLTATARRRERFVVRTGDKVSFVRASAVEWIEATGNYASVYSAGRTHLVRETMKSAEARLDPDQFIRIHRSVIINVDCISSMEPHVHGEWTVLMRNGTRFTSSRTHSARLRGLLR